MFRTGIGIVPLAVLVMLSIVTPAGATFSDSFVSPPYVGGAPLAGQGPWLPTIPIHNRIAVNAGTCGITVWSDSAKTGLEDRAFVNVSESGLVHFSIDVRTNWTTTNPLDWWSIQLLSDTDLVVANWTGRVDRFTAWGWTGSKTQSLTLGLQLPMEAVLDFNLGTIDYFYNGGHVYHDIFTSNPGTSVTEIDIISNGFMGPMETPPSDHIYMNNLVITPEPATLSLLSLGGLAMLRRKRR